MAVIKFDHKEDKIAQSMSLTRERELLIDSYISDAKEDKTVDSFSKHFEYVLGKLAKPTYADALYLGFTIGAHIGFLKAKTGELKDKIKDILEKLD